MSTQIRPEISQKNKYYISKHRYYELKHFCLQYPEWKQDYLEIQNHGLRNVEISRVGKTTRQNSIVETDAIILEELSRKMDMIELTANMADPELANYILLAVTQGVSYEYLLTNQNIPCCRDTFYDRYRRFFWLLNTIRR